MVLPVVRLGVHGLLHRRDGLAHGAVREVRVAEDLVGLGAVGDQLDRVLRVVPRLLPVAPFEGVARGLEPVLRQHHERRGDGHHEQSGRDRDAAAVSHGLRPALRRPARHGGAPDREEPGGHGRHLPVPVDARMERPGNAGGE